MVGGWNSLDLYEKEVLRTVLSEVAMSMFAVTEALLFAWTQPSYLSIPSVVTGQIQAP